MDREVGTLDFIDWPEEAGSWSDEAAHRAFIRTRMNAPYPAGLGYWVIERHDDPTFLGWVLLIPQDTIGPDIEIGWRVRRTARGNGYAPEAAARVLTYGLADLGTPRIVADVHADNAPSRRVAEKVGMRSAGTDPTVPHLVRYTAALPCLAPAR